MSKPKSIRKLNKDELLSLIYNNFGGETDLDELCQCTCCGEVSMAGTNILKYVCDECTIAMEETEVYSECADVFADLDNDYGKED